MERTLWIDGAHALAVVVSATGIALALLVLLRLFGQRSVMRMSTFDVAIILVLGSVGGRVITGDTPTLAAGVVGLITLMMLRWLTQQVSTTRWGAFLTRDRPVLLMAGGRALPGRLAKAQITEQELWQTLRLAGIRRREEVALVILEETGALSVIRRGVPVDRRLLERVVGAEDAPDELFEG